jgi:hypothetical protein
MKKSETLERGLLQYQNREYFEAHESFEILWRQLQVGSARDLLQAWIMICGVWLKLRDRQLDPARRLYRRALELGGAPVQSYFEMEPLLGLGSYLLGTRPSPPDWIQLSIQQWPIPPLDLQRDFIH